MTNEKKQITHPFSENKILVFEYDLNDADQSRFADTFARASNENPKDIAEFIQIIARLNAE